MVDFNRHPDKQPHGSSKKLHELVPRLEGELTRQDREDLRNALLKLEGNTNLYYGGGGQTGTPGSDIIRHFTGIIRYSSGRPYFYSYDETGLTTAALDATSGDDIYIPSGSITLTKTFTIAAGVTCEGAGIYETTLTASGAYGDLIEAGVGSVIGNMTIVYNETNAVSTRVLDCSTTFLHDLIINVTSAGNSSAFAVVDLTIYSGDDGTYMDDVTINLTDIASNAGTYYGLALASTAANFILNKVNINISSDVDVTSLRGMSINGTTTARGTINESNIYVESGADSNIYGIDNPEYTTWNDCTVKVATPSGVACTEMIAVNIDDWTNNFFNHCTFTTRYRSAGNNGYVWTAFVDHPTEFSYCKFIVDGDGTAETGGVGSIAFWSDVSGIILNHCFLEGGDDVDLYINTGTTTVYSVAYDTIENYGTLVCLPGDRAALCADNTFTGNITIEGTLTTEGGRVMNTTRVVAVYTILITDHVVFCNTDAGAYTATLPAGAEGQTFRIINSGSSGNDLSVAPDGAEHLIGVNASIALSDGEALLISYDPNDGWY